MMVRVVVDSAAGLPAEIAEELDITVVPMHVMEDADGEGSTSGLTALELAACYARQLERGGDEGVVALHLTKTMSSTWSAAVTASGVFPGTVRVVDTDTAGMAIGAAAMAAAPMAIPAVSVSTTRTVPGNTPEAVTAADQVEDMVLVRCSATTPSSPPRSSWRA